MWSGIFRQTIIIAWQFMLLKEIVPENCIGDMPLGWQTILLYFSGASFLPALYMIMWFFVNGIVLSKLNLDIF